MEDALSEKELFKRISDAPGIRDAAKEFNDPGYWQKFNELYSPSNTSIRPGLEEDPEVTDRGYWDFWERQIEYNECEVCVWHYPRLGRLKLSPWVVCHRLPRCRPSKGCLNPNQTQNVFMDWATRIDKGTPIHNTNFPPPCPPSRPDPMGNPGQWNLIEIYSREERGEINTGNYPNAGNNNFYENERYLVRRFEHFGVYDPSTNINPDRVYREYDYSEQPRGSDWYIRTGLYGGAYWGYNKTIEHNLGGLYFIYTFLQIVHYHPFFLSTPSGEGWFQVSYSYGRSIYEYEVNGIPYIPDSERLFPEPPSPPKPPMSNCCPQNQADLAQIKRYLIQLMKWTGASPGVMVLPGSLMDKSPGGGWLDNLVDFITPEFPTVIRSWPQFVKWKLEREQEYWGQWPTGAKDEKGNEVYYPNLAVYLSNLQSQLFAQKKVDSQQTIALCKLLLENALGRQDIIQTKSLCFAIVDFLGFEILEKRQKIRHSFKLPEDQEVSAEEVDEIKEVDDFLENTEVDMKVFDFDPRHVPEGSKKPVETFMDTARRVLKVLELLQAVHCIPVDKDNPEPDLKKFIKDYLKINKPPSEDDDLEAWAERVETAFSTDENPPPSVGNNPYGNSYTERPRIKFYGKRAPDTGDQP